jgi:hypothetical protein
MDHPARVSRHTAVAAALDVLSDRQLADLLAGAAPAGAGIGGSTARLDVHGVPVFMMRVPLTDLERAEPRSTANLFGLPPFYQYGIGSAGFSAWRELAAHLLTTGWVLAGEHAGFPLLHHWRVLPRTPGEVPPADPDHLGLGEIDEAVDFWGGSPAVRRRLTALAGATASLVLVLEHLPWTVSGWLAERAAAGDGAAYGFVEREVIGAADFLRARQLVHFDLHLDNLLTDGERVYVADFGLTTGPRFDLDPAEAEFVARHADYDRVQCRTYLCRWLVRTLLGTTPPETDAVLHAWAAGGARGRAVGLPPAAAEILDRHAAVAAADSDFHRALRTVSRTTPYPAGELRARTETARPTPMS